MLNSQKSNKPRTPAARGAVLKNLLLERGYSYASFAELTQKLDPRNKGIAAITIRRLCEGLSYERKPGKIQQYDVAKIHQENAGLILTALGISDTDAWDLFGFETDEEKAIWYTRRPPPLGHGSEERFTVTETLKFPLSGILNGSAIALPAGFILTIDPMSVQGPQVYRMDASYHLQAGDYPAGERLGELVGIAIR